ncbi:MerR family transcriptional regulator [Streptomyces olivaceoviridis]
MFTIGDFARHGRVSVRMPRHYDATGLLRPAHVDPASGYRHYTAAQLARLDRIIALKDLGLTVKQVRDIVDEKVDPEDIGPVIGPLYDELFRHLDSAGIAPTGPGVASYEDAPERGGRITVHAAVQVSAPLQDDGTFRVLDLPALDRAATIVHRGSMDTVLPTAQTLAHWIDAGGYRSTGYPREVNPECPENRDEWVTELQAPVSRA